MAARRQSLGSRAAQTLRPAGEAAMYGSAQPAAEEGRAAAAVPVAVADLPVVSEPAVGGGLGEFDTLIGHMPAGEAVQRDVRAVAADPDQPATRPVVRRSARRARREELIRADLDVPESVKHRAKMLTRPSRTGASRTLGAKWLLESAILCLDEVLHRDGAVDHLDLRGLDFGEQEQAAERIRAALLAWAAEQRDERPSV